MNHPKIVMHFSGSSFLPDAAYWRELARPWKLFTFAVAMALLLYGALVYEISDWDVGVTFIMGILTYASAPWVIETLASLWRPGGKAGASGSAGTSGSAGAAGNAGASGSTGASGHPGASGGTGAPPSGVPKDWPLRIGAALLVAWFVVDGAYWLWHTAMGNVMLRWDNFIVSSLIYFMAGLFWLYRGTLRELMANLTRVLRRS